MQKPAELRDLKKHSIPKPISLTPPLSAPKQSPPLLIISIPQAIVPTLANILNTIAYWKGFKINHRGIIKIGGKEKTERNGSEGGGTGTDAGAGWKGIKTGNGGAT